MSEEERAEEFGKWIEESASLLLAASKTPLGLLYRLSLLQAKCNSESLQLPTVEPRNSDS